MPVTNISPNTCNQHLVTYGPTLANFEERYSSLLSHDIKNLSPERLYICPLCIEQYIISLPDGIYASTEFSEDHVPPQSVGGRLKILVCKKCNNDAGFYEAELQKLMNFGSVPDKRHQSILPQTKVIHRDTGMSFPVSIRRTETSVDIQFYTLAKQYNSKLKDFLKQMHAGEISSLTIQVGAPDESKITKALLKSTYLLAFAWWGYEFVYSTNGSWIREVLLGERSYPTRVPTVWREFDNSSMIEGVSLLLQDNIKQAFVITFELKTDTLRMMAAILIPSPTINGWSKLSELNNAVEAKIPTIVTAVHIPKTITPHGYTEAWQLL